MPDLFGKKQLGRATTGGRFYATPTERVEAGAVYFPDESSLLFGVAEYTVEAGNLGAFATEGTFFFERPDDWLDSLGRKVFYRPSTGEIVNQDKKGDVLIGFQIFANVPDDKLGVVLTSGENSVVIIVTSTADSGAGSLRKAIADAQDGDVILFDSDVFPTGQTTSILLSSYIAINKSVNIYGGESDGAGGYTSGATKEYYVYRDVEGTRTKVVIASPSEVQEGETVLLSNVCRVRLDGQNAVRHIALNTDALITVTIRGVEFKNGSAGYGGAFYQQGSSRFDIADCSFNNCAASGSAGGAVAAVQNSSFRFARCDFSNISAAGSGGAINAGSAGQSAINGCVFDGCSATTNGGGVSSASSSQNTLTGCIFDGCSATMNGGGVSSASSSQNTLTGCIFDGCSATTNGGGVCSTNTSQNTLNNCTFDGCSATSGGGAFSSSTSQNILNDCTLTNCNATVTGGGVYTNNSSQNTLTGCVVDSCTSENGGGVYSYADGKNLLNNCMIKNCTATKSGGGLFSNQRSYMTLNSCQIENCSSASGGGAYFTNESQNTLTDCVVDSCSATAGGGAVYTYTNSRTTFNNCRITNCTAITGGAAIYSAGTTQNTLNNCDLGDNTNYVGVTSVLICNTSNLGSVNVASNAYLMITGGVTILQRLVTNKATIDDGAALTITDSATFATGTQITSEGRGYLATAAGIDISSATLTGVVACSYGAGLESFEISEDGASWTAQDLTTPILIEEKGDGATWTTLSDDATGGNYSDTFEIGTTLRAFDGVRFFVASLDAYWQVEPFVVASNGGGGAGDASPSWTVQDATITPNVEEV